MGLTISRSIEVGDDSELDINNAPYWTREEVARWLKESNFGQYAGTSEKNNH
jgi:hypothetical protein